MGPGFESLKVHQWPIGQVVKTAASHAVNIGSNPVWVTIFLLTPVFLGAIIFLLLEAKRLLTYIDGSNPSLIVGIDCREGPPVPIPNTEVKLTCAEDTWLATARENR